jgi:hypothetical protein
LKLAKQLGCATLEEVDARITLEDLILWEAFWEVEKEREK